MPRALVAEWTSVPETDREHALERWRDARNRLEADGGRCWVYESDRARGSFVVFTEARDAETLRAARARAGIAGRDDDILLEVELH